MKIGTRKPNDHYRKMIDLLKTSDGAEFTLASIAMQTGVPMDVVGAFLLSNFRRGFLSRKGGRGISRYKYRVKKMFAVQESKGTVAQAVWEVFLKERDSLKPREVLQRVNEGRLRKLRKGSISTVIQALHKRGALIRTSQGYVLNRAFKERPSITCRPKSEARPIAVPFRRVEPYTQGYTQA